MLIKALIATEDNRFYDHHGLDFRGIAGPSTAIYGQKGSGRRKHSTQQLAKVLFLTPERSYTRKLKEMALALRIEQRYTKEEILSLYLNQIYFGSGAYGVEAASRIYFNKPAKELNLAECALLAGLPRSPKYYSPFKSPRGAIGRRAYVLNRMAATGIITKAQAEEAKQAPLPVRSPLRTAGTAPYFVEYVRQKVEERFGSSILYTGGLNIYTTIDDELQAYAEEAFQKGLAKDRIPEPEQKTCILSAPGRAHRHRTFHRAYPCHGRREGLRPEPVQPGVAGIPPAGICLQTHHLCSGPRPRLDRSGHPAGLPDDRETGPEKDTGLLKISPEPTRGRSRSRKASHNR